MMESTGSALLAPADGWHARVRYPVRVVKDAAGVSGCAHLSTGHDRFGFRSCVSCGVTLQWWAGWVARGVFGDDEQTLRWIRHVDTTFTEPANPVR